MNNSPISKELRYILRLHQSLRRPMTNEPAAWRPSDDLPSWILQLHPNIFPPLAESPYLQHSNVIAFLRNTKGRPRGLMRSLTCRCSSFQHLVQLHDSTYPRASYVSVRTNASKRNAVPNGAIGRFSTRMRDK